MIKINNILLNQNYLKDLFYYDFCEGVLYWRKNMPFHRLKGRKAGYHNKRNYIEIRINNKLYLAHRLIWIYVYGKINVNKEIDHINHIRFDNRINNLREVKREINHKNRSLSIKNSSGYTGVYWNKKFKKWSAQICINYKQIYIGSFNEIEDAKDAYNKEKLKHNFHKNHGGYKD